ncbi:MAG: cyclase family protein, partial [Candidatus Nanopelagicaceae bacterium]
MIVDLSHVLRTGIQIYPGDPQVDISQALNVEKDFVNVLAVNMGSQSGTHVDSPFHVFADGKKLNEVDLSHFIGSGVVINATGLSDRQEIPTECFTGTDVQGATIAIVRTDWSQYFGTDKYLSHPYPNIESLDYLKKHGITTIALDFLSLDRTPRTGEDFTLDNHYFWSQGDGIIGENFTNIAAISVSRPLISMLP